MVVVGTWRRRAESCCRHLSAIIITPPATNVFSPPFSFTLYAAYAERSIHYSLFFRDAVYLLLPPLFMRRYDDDWHMMNDSESADGFALRAILFLFFAVFFLLSLCLRCFLMRVPLMRAVGWLVIAGHEHYGDQAMRYFLFHAAFWHYWCSYKTLIVFRGECRTVQALMTQAWGEEIDERHFSFLPPRLFIVDKRRAPLFRRRHDIFFFFVIFRFLFRLFSLFFRLFFTDGARDDDYEKDWWDD